jgi:hypothetical protein
VGQDNLPKKSKICLTVFSTSICLHLKCQAGQTSFCPCREQGLQGKLSEITKVLSDGTGEKPKEGSVWKNIATNGVLTALARCIGPESVDITALAKLNKPGK